MRQRGGPFSLRGQIANESIAHQQGSLLAAQLKDFNLSPLTTNHASARLVMHTNAPYGARASILACKHELVMFSCRAGAGKAMCCATAYTLTERLSGRPLENYHLHVSTPKTHISAIRSYSD
eukprot:1699550-Prymnesium_polylepis.1